MRSVANALFRLTLVGFAVKTGVSVTGVTRLGYEIGGFLRKENRGFILVSDVYEQIYEYGQNETSTLR